MRFEAGSTRRSNKKFGKERTSLARSNKPGPFASVTLLLWPINGPIFRHAMRTAIFAGAARAKLPSYQKTLISRERDKLETCGFHRLKANEKVRTQNGVRFRSISARLPLFSAKDTIKKKTKREQYDFARVIHTEGVLTTSTLLFK